MKPAGFVVFEYCEDFEQALALDCSDGLPRGGLLVWSNARRPGVLFPTRKAARQAITRTAHYAAAYGSTDFPQKALCKVRPLLAVASESEAS